MTANGFDRGPAARTISVIVPVHNASAFLLETLRSLDEQEVPLHEIVIVEDGSSDGSLDLIRKFAATARTPTSVIVNSEAQGVARARNLGVLRASGEWIGLCDNDDLWMPHRSSVVHDYLDAHPEARSVATDYTGFALESDREALALHPRSAMVDQWTGRTSDLPSRPTERAGTNADLEWLTLDSFRAATSLATVQAVFLREDYIVAGGCASWCFRADDWILNGSIAGSNPIPLLPVSTVWYRVRTSSQSHVLDQSTVSLLAASTALRLGSPPSPSPDLSNAFHMHLVERLAQEAPFRSFVRAVGFALIGGCTPRQLARICRLRSAARLAARSRSRA